MSKDKGYRFSRSCLYYGTCIWNNRCLASFNL